jgi:hypothetical protein
MMCRKHRRPRNPYKCADPPLLRLHSARRSLISSIASLSDHRGENENAFFSAV